MLKKPTFYLAIIGVIMAVVLVGKLRRPDPQVPPLAEPTSAPYKDALGASGLVESVNENVRIAPNAPGLVAEVFVAVGDAVEKGQPLFQLDNRDATAAIATQTAQLAVLQASISQSEILLADKTDMLNRVNKLSQNAVSSIDERTRANFAAREASAALVKSKAELQQAQASLEQARVSLNLLTTRAPRAGRILQINVRAGEQTTVTEPAMILGDVAELQLRADVDEDYATRVAPDCEAVAFIKGSRENSVQLRFVRIEPYVVPKKSLTGLSNERVDTRVLQIIFRFERPSFPVYVGQQMDVFINSSKSLK